MSERTTAGRLILTRKVSGASPQSTILAQSSRMFSPTLSQLIGLKFDNQYKEQETRCKSEVFPQPAHLIATNFVRLLLRIELHKSRFDARLM